MEFLIFVFILISILSSLMKRRTREWKKKKESFFDPWTFEEEIPKEKSESIEVEIAEEIEEREKEEITIFDQDAKIREEEKELAFEPELLLDEVSMPGEAEIYALPSELKERTPEILSLLLEKEKDKQLTVDREEPYLGKELDNFLRNGKLPLAIVFSEILGPPRAFKPARSITSRGFSSHLSIPHSENREH
ncbi:MAG TPA: hypothetical protein PK267_02135 [Atribacterota bacterium]|nr:hypothetical protein [Atribacterota bacterium]